MLQPVHTRQAGRFARLGARGARKEIEEEPLEHGKGAGAVDM